MLHQENQPLCRSVFPLGTDYSLGINDSGGRPGIHEVFCCEVTAILHGPCFARALFVIYIHLAEEEAPCQIYEATDLEAPEPRYDVLLYVSS